VFPKWTSMVSWAQGDFWAPEFHVMPDGRCANGATVGDDVVTVPMAVSGCSLWRAIITVCCRSA
jgi:hypothetical protein